MKQLKLAILVLTLSSYNVKAQGIKIKEVIKDDFNRISLCKPDTILPASIENQKDFLLSIANAKNEINFQLERSFNDGDNLHNHYQIQFKKIPVYGASYVVHSNKGFINFANGNLPFTNVSLVSIASINYEEAKKYLDVELIKKLKTEKVNSSTFHNKDLVWFSNGNKLELAYKIEVQNGDVLLTGNYIVDAKNGSILYFEPSICANHTAKIPPNAAGAAQTLYSGNQNFITDAFNGQFRLREIRNGVNILTLNAGNEINTEVFIFNATDFVDNDNNWQAVEHNNNRYATDVHWATEQAVDYWRIVHNRNSINNLGMNVVSFIHAFAANTLNAFWSSQYQVMMYGDGAGSLGPLGTLDVVAHEIGHGICQFTAGLISGTAQSGALNEGFSDIWGAVIEGWVAPGKQRWRIGEEVFFPNLRNLENPNDATAVEGPHPDTYLGTFWRTNGEPHNNSTVLSHWFFRLAQGGAGTNDFGNNFNVNGQGINIAARIAYLTEQNLSNSANYNQVRNVSIQVTRDEYGVRSCQEAAVTRAWFAVGVGANFIGIPGPIPTIIGDTIVCTNKTYSLQNIPSGSTVTWFTSSYYTVAPQNAAGTTVIVTRNGTGLVNLGVNVAFNGNNPCGIADPTFYASKLIKFGSPLPATQYPYWTQNGVTNYMNDCNAITQVDQNTTSASGYVTDAVTNTYSWSKVGSAPNSKFTWTSSNNSFSVTVLNKFKFNSDWITLRCSTTNQCGTAFRDYKFVLDPGICTAARPVRNNSNVIIYPNPTNDIFNVELNKGIFIKRIIIKNKLGVTIKSFNYDNNLSKQLISFIDFPQDVYTIQVFDGNIWYTSKVIKE